MEKEIKKYQIIRSVGGCLLMGELGKCDENMCELLNPLTVGYIVNQGLKGVEMKFQPFDPVQKIKSLIVKPDIMYYPDKNQIELYLKYLGKEYE